MRVELKLPASEHDSLVAHLLPEGSVCEEAAFGFAETQISEGELLFQLKSWLAVPPDGFAVRSRYFLHLSDATRAMVIKRAHELNASLIEFHSHPLQSVAEFSESDCLGFGEFVPHVQWRLKGNPYAAFVFGPTSFDALAWTQGIDGPHLVDVVTADGRELRPTGESFRNWEGTSYGS